MRTLLALALLAAIATSGCSGKFWGGTAAGTLAAGGGYEYNLHQQKERIDKDLKEERITQQEYNIRKDQIERDSLIQ